MNKKPILIGIAGKKQSGKNILCSFVSEYKNAIFGKETRCEIYSFAQSLKEEVCINLLGLNWDQCYGSDKQKNSLTVYKWEQFPEHIRGDKTGNITAREFLQIVGTNIFRRYFDENVWVNSLFRKMSKVKLDVALISDVRFITEIEKIISYDGYVIRLTRNVCERDIHITETELDSYDFKNKNRCYVLDNKNMNIGQQNAATYKLLKEIF